MVTSPNQRIIRINRNIPKQTEDNTKPYMIAWSENIENASRNLSTGGAFKVYMYLLSNKDNYTFGCSPQDISNKYGISLKTAKDGINQLIEQGYLVAINKNTYEFYETPRTTDLEPVAEVRKKFSSKGQILELTYSELIVLVGDEKAEIAWKSAT